MERDEFRRRVGTLLGVLDARLHGAGARIHRLLDHGEQQEAMDVLAAALFTLACEVTVAERAELHAVFRHARSWRTDDATFVRHSVSILDMLPRVGQHRFHRGLPRQRGGHEPGGTGRRRVPRFPPGWTGLQIAAAAESVGSGRPDVVLANDRRWYTGTSRGVETGVLRSADHEVRAVVPLAGTEGTADLRSPGEMTPSEVVTAMLPGRCRRSIAVIGPWLATPERRALTQLTDTGEWEETADAVAAHLAGDGRVLGADDLAEVRRLLMSFDLPVPGCAYLDDREAILARLEGT